MGYKVKWVEDHLGVTRKALRNFEKKGLLRSTPGEDRNYDADDIERIWRIRVLQGMGYTLNEIVEMATSEDYDLRASISSKINELEIEIDKRQKHLKFAKRIKMTGRIPMWPKDFGDITFDKFLQQSIADVNEIDFPPEKEYEYIVENYYEHPEKMQDNKYLGAIIKIMEQMDFSDEQFNSFLTLQGLTSMLFEKIGKGCNNNEVQLLVQLVYDAYIQLYGKEVPKADFGRIFSSSFVAGDGALPYINQYGEPTCEAVANAIAIFGGYENFDDAQERRKI